MRTLISAILLASLLASCELAPPRPSAAPTAQPPSTQLPVSPTPVPASVQLERGLALRTIGEYDAAAEQFHSLIDTNPTDLRVPTAAYYLAESFVLRERWVSAIAALTPIALATPAQAYTARSLFLLARAHEQTGEDAQAAALYQRYADLNTPLAAYAQLRRGEVLLRLARPDQAALAFEFAATSTIVPSKRALAYERAILAQRDAQKLDDALRLSVALLDLAKDPTYRANILFDAASLAEATGQPERRVAWLTEILEQSPTTPQAVQAADLLLADQTATLDPALAAFVFANGQRWSTARGQLDAAIATATGEQQLDLRRRRALTFREGDSPDYATTLALLDELLLDAAPDSDVARQARLDRIQTLGQSGDQATAAAAYRAYAAELPDDPRAPEALRRAAVLLERLNQPVIAAQVRYDAAKRYPDDHQSGEGLFAAGWGFYQAGMLAEANQAWQLQAEQSTGLLAAQGAYWAGRTTREAGDVVGGNKLLQQAAMLAPRSFYAARAEDLLGIVRKGTLPISATLTEQDWAVLSTWVEQWADPLTADQSTPTVALVMQDQTSWLARAMALDDIGLAADARAEWQAAWLAVQRDPRSLLLLARIAHEHGRTDVVLDITDQMLELAPARAMSTMPTIMARLRLPTPYVQSVLAAAHEQQIDPLVVYSLIRQESRFAAQIISVAGASGLTQVMPDTARGIAQRLQVADFRDTDLARPSLNIRFGAFYLGTQLRQLEHNIHAALAAYNGGPTNALRWMQLPGASDPDRFIEGIDYGETQAYVKIVYANYAAYQRLYQTP